LVALPVTLNDPTQKIAKGCQDTQGSSFIVSGRGGMATNPPHDRSFNNRFWADLRDLSKLQTHAIAP
jgi:hypothetical protein